VTEWVFSVGTALITEHTFNENMLYNENSNYCKSVVQYLHTDYELGLMTKINYEQYYNN